MVAATLTSAVLLVLLVVKVPNGAWASVLLMVLLGVGMHRIHRHYDLVAEEVALPEDAGPDPMPARVHAVVLVSRLHRPVTRALAYARATRPSTLEAVTVATDPAAADAYRQRAATVRASGLEGVADGVLARWFTPGWEHSGVDPRAPS